MLYTIKITIAFLLTILLLNPAPAMAKEPGVFWVLSMYPSELLRIKVSPFLEQLNKKSRLEYRLKPSLNIDRLQQQCSSGEPHLIGLPNRQAMFIKELCDYDILVESFQAVSLAVREGGGRTIGQVKTIAVLKNYSSTDIVIEEMKKLNRSVEYIYFDSYFDLLASGKSESFDAIGVGNKLMKSALGGNIWKVIHQFKNSAKAMILVSKKVSEPERKVIREVLVDDPISYQVWVESVGLGGWK